MFYNQEIKEVLKQVDSSLNGLTNEQVSKRRDENHLNKLQEEKRTSIFKKFIAQFSDVMVIILLVSAGISITLDLAQKNYKNLFEGGVILFIVLLNATLGVIQESKAENTLENLKKQVEPEAKVIRDGAIVNVKTEDLVVGDIVLLETGNIVPADIRLIESSNLLVDEASLTGESVAVEKDATKIVKQCKILADQVNMVFSNTIISMGKGCGVVVKIGKDTEMGKIAHMLVNGKKELTPLQKSLNKIGKIISLSVIIISIFIFFIELLMISQIGWLEAFMSAVALAVAAIPESLPAVITIIMALGVQKLAKKNAIIKRLHAVETLGNCQIICSDKTGTITQNKMKVQKCYYNLNIYSKQNSNNIVLENLTKCMLLCNDCYENDNEIVGEPTEKALFEFGKEYSLFYKDVIAQNKKIFEVPFTSDRKMMTVVVENSKHQIISYTKGGLDEVLNLCDSININGKVESITPSIKKQILQAGETMCNGALRVMAFATKCYYNFNKNDNFETSLTLIGLAGMIDPPRPGVFEAVKKCHEASLRPVMITGDHKNTAFAIARQLDIATYEKQVITGRELDKLSDEQLKKDIMKYTVFARVNPEHKVRIVKTFKSLGKIVAMTGDGVNDAPSLKIADIGIGMGIMGTQVTKDVADMIITDDNFATIITAVGEGRKIYSNIQKTIQFLLSTNAVEVVTLFCACVFFPSFVFLLPSQILFINFITDSLPAIGLGLEDAEKDSMQLPPHNNKIIDKRVGFNILYQAFTQIVIVLTVYIIGLKFYNNMVASTMSFFVINYMQLLHSVNLKTNHSLLHINLFKNKAFNITFLIGFSIVTMVAVLKPLQIVFGLASLNLVQWFIVAIASTLIIPLVEIFKKIIYILIPERIK